MVVSSNAIWNLHRVIERYNLHGRVIEPWNLVVVSLNAIISMVVSLNAIWNLHGRVIERYMDRSCQSPWSCH